MNAYHSESSYHRPVLALAAAALAALSLALGVVVPAQHEPESTPAWTAMDLRAAGGSPIAVTISPARIDVIARRAQETAMQSVPRALPERRS